MDFISHWFYTSLSGIFLLLALIPSANISGDPRPAAFAESSSSVPVRKIEVAQKTFLSVTRIKVGSEWSDKPCCSKRKTRQK